MRLRGLEKQDLGQPVLMSLLELWPASTRGFVSGFQRQPPVGSSSAWGGSRISNRSTLLLWMSHLVRLIAIPSARMQASYAYTTRDSKHFSCSHDIEEAFKLGEPLIAFSGKNLVNWPRSSPVELLRHNLPRILYANWSVC